MPCRAGVLRAGAAAVALFFAVATPVSSGGQDRAPAPVTRTVCIRGVCFVSELAVTEEERSRGLMHRAALAGDRGMLFVFPLPGRHQFWMKNTLIELDIVFLGEDRRVVSVAKRAEPCRKEPCRLYGPDGDAAYALEIAGGLSDRHGFAAGDLAEFR